MPVQSKSKILNLFLVNQLEKEESSKQIDQAQATPGKEPVPHDSWGYRSLKEKVTIPNLEPSIPEKLKRTNASLNHNLREFLMHNDLPNSGNPLNDHSIFDSAPILSEGWIYPVARYYSQVNPRRTAPFDNIAHHAKFKCIFGAVSFDKNNPICLDRNGKILDGAYRMYAMGKLNEEKVMSGQRVYVRIYDFE